MIAMTLDQSERLVLAFERMAEAQEDSLKISARALVVQEQMAASSRALELTLRDSNGH